MITRERVFNEARSQGMSAFRSRPSRFARHDSKNPYPQGSTQREGFREGWSIAEREWRRLGCPFDLGEDESDA